MVEAILMMQRAYYEATGRRLTMLAVGPRIFWALKLEAEARISDGRWMDSSLPQPLYSGQMKLGDVTIIESLGEGMVWA